MMSDTLSKLQQLKQEEEKAEGKAVVKPFKNFQEEAILSLALDQPDFFASISHFLKPEMFTRLEVRWVIAELFNLHEKYKIIPTRAILRDHIESSLTEDDPFEEVLRIVDRKSDYREVPIVKDLLLTWARKKAYGMIYTPEAIEHYKNGEYAQLEKLFNDANKIADIGNGGFWFLDNYAILFEPETIEHRTTGFPRLDKILNNGGPSAKEVVCWLAATNVGKCHTLQSKIVESKMSRIYELELEDGTIKKIAGFRKVRTMRGLVRVCDLTNEDDVEEISFEDNGDITL